MDDLQNEQQPFQISIDKLQQQVDKLEWSDIQSLDIGNTPENEYYQLIPQKTYAKFYRLFRIVLNQEEISGRSYVLSTLMLRLKSTNYYALMLRSRYFMGLPYQVQNFTQEIFFINCLLNSNSKQYQLWTYKKALFGHFKSQINMSMQFNFQENEFLDYLLDSDSKNYHVWDYKLWLTLYFQKEKEQIAWTEQIIYSDNPNINSLNQSLEGTNFNICEQDFKNCNSFWSYRYNLIRIYHQTLESKEEVKLLQFEELKKLTNWIKLEKYQKNECAWNYFAGLTLACCDYQILKNSTNFSLNFFTLNKNRFAASVFIQFCDQLSEKYNQPTPKKIEVINELLICDNVRQLYYTYLLSQLQP